MPKMTPEEQQSVDEQLSWRLLTGEQQRYEQEYLEYWSRNPPPQLRPVWQKVLIVLVPVAIVAGMAWLAWWVM
jgi:hypothetical protein